MLRWVGILLDGGCASLWDQLPSILVDMNMQRDAAGCDEVSPAIRRLDVTTHLHHLPMDAGRG